MHPRLKFRDIDGIRQARIIYGDKEIPLRPSRNDRDIREEVFEHIKDDVADAYGIGIDDRCMESIKNFFVNSTEEDSYRIVWDIEFHLGLNGSSVAIDAFEKAMFWPIVQKHILAWKEKNKLQPLFKIGDIISFNNGKTGKILKLEDKYSPACYSVMSTELNPGCVYMVPWESCSLVEDC